MTDIKCIVLLYTKDILVLGFRLFGNLAKIPKTEFQNPKTNFTFV